MSTYITIEHLIWHEMTWRLQTETSAIELVIVLKMTCMSVKIERVLLRNKQ